MKKYLLMLICFGTFHCIAQTETFDLATYTPPSKQDGWKKEVKNNLVSYTKTDNVKKTWCQIGIYRSTSSKGSIEADFDSEWQLLIATPYKIQAAPKSGGIQEAEGWKIKVGSGTFLFNNGDAQAILSVMSGYGRVVSIVAINNSQDYFPNIQALMVSVKLTIPETIPETILETNTDQVPLSNSDTSPIAGSWGKSNSVGQINNRFGNYSYNKQQYTFNANGSYSFAGKTYDEQYSETLLIKENGNFIINGKSITITPITSVIEAWSKKNGADNWNQLISSQKRKLEKVTYQFSISDGSLLLQTTKETERDGRFNNGNTYTYGPMGTFTPIQLPGGEQTVSKEVQTEPVQHSDTPATSPVTISGFAFTSTNFDDGWTSSIKEDWVEVTKGNIKVLVHFPKEGTIFPADPEPLTTAAWNILVAPRYDNLKNYKTSYVEDYKRPYFGTGYATENQTGKSVFVVLFRRGGGWFEVVAPDNNSFTQEFGFNPESIRWGSISEYMGGWVVDNSKGLIVKADPEIFDKLENMVSYNKFAVAASDINNTGEWKDSFSSNTYYANYYTGAYAGMSTYTSSSWFVFKAGYKYHWQLVAANSYGGAMDVAQAKSDGTFKSLNNWQMYFSDMEGKPKTFDVYFTAIKGGRVLWMNDAKYPGSGIFTGYSKSK